MRKTIANNSQTNCADKKLECKTLTIIIGNT